VLHRDDGPAVCLADGTKFWYKDGMIHRDNGPAVILPDGKTSWYLNGKIYRAED
jgi:hypothetical protein